MEFTTPGGALVIDKSTDVQFMLPEFHSNRALAWKFVVSNQGLGNYDMILGRDFLEELGIDVKFSSMEVEWEGSTIPLKPIDATAEEFFMIAEPTSVTHATERVQGILDANYEAADLDEIVSQCSHLTKEDQTMLLALLRKYEPLFDGKLGTWKGAKYDIELKSDAKPYHARFYPIPRIHQQTLKREVERLCKIGVLKRVNHSEWAAPTFIIPKKDQTVRFISDFRELNKRIVRKPYPIPKIQDLLLNLEGFTYASSLDLNMGYYHIELSPNSKKLCTIALPWGKYEYQKLPMGLCNSPDIFQEKMNELFDGLDTIRVYLDDLLHITKGSFSDHLEKLDEILSRIQDAGLKVNAKKSFFGKGEVEYLGYVINREGIQPMAKKINAIQSMAAPRSKKELRRFIGIVNYYRDMWQHRSHILAPLARLTSKDVKWNWTEVAQKAFDQMKQVISKRTLLTYPDFNKPFEIHTDASHYQLGAVISQDNKPVAFYSRKLNPAQVNYTTTERELLSIVETLKEFRNILLGHKIVVHTDHQNLTYKNFNTERVMRWRLILEEFGPELHYIKGEKNIVADALSRMDIGDTTVPQRPQAIATLMAMEKDDNDAYHCPLTYKLIEKHQVTDKGLLKQAKSKAQGYALRTFHGGGKSHDLLCYNGKICIPKSLQKRCVDFYHNSLMHPGTSRTEASIRQHFHWAGLSQMVKRHCETCHKCQVTKNIKPKIGKLPAKQAEATPWDVLCVDLIGPYTIERKGKADLKLHALTMIDPATGWFEIIQIRNKGAMEIANQVELKWLCRYPWPTQIIVDRGREFMGEFLRMCHNDYGIKTKPITTRNPQANSIIERVHKTIGDMIRSAQPQELGDDVEDPLEGVLAAVAFGVRATYHTTLQATPAQLVFGRDSILNIKHEANWEHIRQRKQTLINQNNERENDKRREHTYQVGDKVLVENYNHRKFGKDAFIGPYTILKVNNNGSVQLNKRLSRGNLTQTWNIRKLKPYKE